MRGTRPFLYSAKSGPDGCPGSKGRAGCQAGPIFPAHAPLRIQAASPSHSTALRTAFHANKWLRLHVSDLVGRASMNIILTPYPLLVNAAGQESTVDHQGVPGNERCGGGAKI